MTTLLSKRAWSVKEKENWSTGENILVSIKKRLESKMGWIKATVKKGLANLLKLSRTTQSTEETTLFETLPTKPSNRLTPTSSLKLKQRKILSRPVLFRLQSRELMQCTQVATQWGEPIRQTAFLKQQQASIQIETCCALVSLDHCLPTSTTSCSLEETPRDCPKENKECLPTA